jgi:FixJ family two-component response regulator
MSEQPWVSVVDDDESLRAALIRLLRSVGIHARGFGSAEEFLGHTDAPVPVCAVVDIHMGEGLNGYELKELLETEGKALPIIFMTAHAQLPVRMLQDSSAVANCLRKPFDKDELLGRLRRILGAVLVTAMIAMSTASARAQPVQENKRVLIVYAHNPNAPGVVAFAGQLKAVLQAQIPTGLEIYDEYLDADRFPYPARSAQLARYFAEKYQLHGQMSSWLKARRPVRFVHGSPAWLCSRTCRSSTEAVRADRRFLLPPANVVGRREPLPFASDLLAGARSPSGCRTRRGGRRRVADDSLLIAEARRQITPLLNGTQLDLYQNWSYEALIDSLRHFPPRTFVLLSTSRGTRADESSSPGTSLPAWHAWRRCRRMGIARNWVGDGIVGGGRDGLRGRRHAHRETPCAGPPAGA